MSELKESYNELLRAFSELKLASNDRVIELEKVLANKVASIKVKVSLSYVSYEPIHTSLIFFRHFKSK